MIEFIDTRRERFGVEPICGVLHEHGCGIAPNTYWKAKKRTPSARAGLITSLSNRTEGRPGLQGGRPRSGNGIAAAPIAV